MNGLKIIICTNRRLNPRTPSCAARGSEALMARLVDSLQAEGIEIEVEEVKCLGQCEVGPNLRIAPGGSFYNRFDASDIPRLVEEIRFLASQFRSNLAG